MAHPQPPPESQASLDSMWRQVWQKVRSICQEEIKKVLGANYVGGKLDGGAIGGTVPPAALPVATTSTLGVVEVGSGLAVTSGGVISATGSSSGVPWINVKDPTYGATGNGTADDTAAISAAIAAVPSVGGVLYFPAGTYKTSGGFTLANPVIVRGDGGADATGYASAPTTIECTAGSASLFTVSTSAATFVDLLLQGTASTPTAGAAITVSSSNVAQRVNYERITVHNFYVGIDIQVGSFWTMHACQIVGPVLYGIKIQNTVNVDAGDWAISDTSFLCDGRNATAAIRIESSGGGKISTCKVVGSWSGGYKYAYGIQRVSSVSTAILLVDNCSLEGLTTAGVALTSSGGAWHMTILSNLEIACDGGSVYGIQISAGATGQIDDIIISNCIMLATSVSTHAAVDLSNVANVFLDQIMNLGFSGGVLAQSGCSNVVYDTGSSGSGTVTSVSGTTPVSVATGTTTPVISVAAVVASGASHAAGLVPDPGATAGTTRYLREDATFAVPPGGSGAIYGPLLDSAHNLIVDSAGTVILAPR